MAAPVLGTHVPVGCGLATQGLAYAREVGARAVQVFVTNPRGWTLTPGRPSEDALFAAAVSDGLPAFVHTSYLVNLASPDPETVRRSVASLRHSASRAAEIGARGVVVHTGSAVTTGRSSAALRQVRKTLRPLLDELPDDGPNVLLEPTAGQGRSLCSTLPELEDFLDVVGPHERMGLCIDTCHAYAAGHDLAQRGGMKQFLDDLTKVTASCALQLVHANDSVDGCGSGRDRHAAIGRGRLGERPFAALLRHPLTRGVPVVLETPGDAASHREQLRLLQRLGRRRRHPAGD